jgi:hypothetical protein
MHDSATRSLSGVIICPANKDSGYMANSIAYTIIRAAQQKSIYSHRRLLCKNKHPNAAPDAFPGLLL